ncbi:MAG: hypothetical protein JWO94_105 [Verrucomicrobiaceae bacterium]|nr:hypothetical protein [Verrucomicrobiaceae bacterium]
MATASPILAFEAAAGRARQRVTLRRWLRLATQTWGWATLAVALGVVLVWLGLVGAWLPVLVLAAWLGGSAGWTWRRRPGKYQALALWDEVRQASEAFAAAWWYGSQPQRTAMQQRHLEAQAAVLHAALPGLARALPLPLDRRLWLAPALLCAGLAGSAWVHRGTLEPGLSDAMKQTAVVEARSIAQTDWQKKKLQGLTSLEKAAVEKLKQDIKTTATDLQSDSGKSAREVLNNLEKRAREAEKLAQRLGSDADAWASEKLVDALRKHADTAELGDAVAGKNPAQTAKAAADLASQLQSPQSPVEFRERLAASLKEIRKQAEAADRKRMVGSHVIAAGEQMEAGGTPEAAREFDQLAAAMRDLARREQSRKELEKLAQQLRDAGSRIAGNQGGGLQKMAAAGQSGPQSAQSQAGQGMQPMQGGQVLSQAPLQPPGLAQNAPSATLRQAPDSAVGQQSAGVAQMQPGQQVPDHGRPMLIAPVPGMKPPDKPPEMLMLGKDAGKPMDGPSITLNIPGGQEAGNGTAKLDAAATAAKKAAHDSQVNAARGGQGAATSRSVEGGIRQEAEARGARQVAVDFIQQQEAALDEAALPPARREQVRRYFTELRKRFEETGK